MTRRCLVAGLLLLPPVLVLAGPAAADSPHNVVVSVATRGGAGNDDSGAQNITNTARNEATISGTGRFVAFESLAGNLAPGDHNDRASVFVRDRDVDRDGRLDEAGQVRTTLISIGTNGEYTPGAQSTAPSISRSGRFVAFQSVEALVPEDTNHAGDVYVRDRDTDRDGIFDEPGAVRTSRVSVGVYGQQADNASMDPTITADGRFVAFSSIATTFGAGESDNLQDIYVRDRDVDRDGILDEPDASTTVLVSRLPDGRHEQTTSEMPSITPNGRFVVWNSLASAADPSDTNHAMDIFVQDRDADRDGILDEAGAVTTTRVSRGRGDAVPNQESQEAVISDNGRFVAFSSQASNLVSGDTNGVRDIFVVDRDPDRDQVFDENGGRTDRTRRVSVTGKGKQANGRSSGSTMSADGRVVVFESYASNLDRQSGLCGVYLRDRDADRDGVYDETKASITQTLSLDSRNGPANGSSLAPALSANRRWVAFSSYAEDLVRRQRDNNVTDVVVRGPLG